MTVLVAVVVLVEAAVVVGRVGTLEARRAETRRVDRLLVEVDDILIIIMELEGSACSSKIILRDR